MKKKEYRIVISNYLVLMTDSLLVLISVFGAYLLRFNFSIPESEIKPLPKILIFVLVVRIGIFLVSKSYAGTLKYVTIFDIFTIFIYTTLGSFIFLITNVVSYYLISKNLFIPLTIIILEFLITTFLLFSFRGFLKVRHSLSMEKKQLDRLKQEITRQIRY